MTLSFNVAHEERWLELHDVQRDLFMRSLVGAQRSAAVLFQEQPDAQTDAWLDHLAPVELQVEYGRLQAERAEAQAAWAAMSDDERGAVLDWCDRLDAEGRLEDHRFFEQWLSLRMQGYVGDGPGGLRPLPCRRRVVRAAPAPRAGRPRGPFVPRARRPYRQAVLADLPGAGGRQWRRAVAPVVPRRTGGAGRADEIPTGSRRRRLATA